MNLGFSDGSDSKESTCNAGDLGQEGALEKGTGTHCSIIAWRISWTEEPGGLLAESNTTTITM